MVYITKDLVEAEDQLEWVEMEHFSLNTILFLVERGLTKCMLPVSCRAVSAGLFFCNLVHPLCSRHLQSQHVKHIFSSMPFLCSRNVQWQRPAIVHPLCSRHLQSIHR